MDVSYWSSRTINVRTHRQRLAVALLGNRLRGQAGLVAVAIVLEGVAFGVTVRARSLAGLSGRAKRGAAQLGRTTDPTDPTSARQVFFGVNDDGPSIGIRRARNLAVAARDRLRVDGERGNITAGTVQRGFEVEVRLVHGTMGLLERIPLLFIDLDRPGRDKRRGQQSGSDDGNGTHLDIGIDGWKEKLMEVCFQTSVRVLMLWSKERQERYR